MPTQNLKKLLRDQLTLEMELIELIEDCLKEIFKVPAEQRHVLSLFRENIENMDDWGCVQSLNSLRHNIVVNGEYIYRKEQPTQA